MKRKQFIKGTEQIAQEGAIQIFKIPGAGLEEVIVGVVGTLQFDVFQYRMRNEYEMCIRDRRGSAAGTDLPAACHGQSRTGPGGRPPPAKPHRRPGPAAAGNARPGGADGPLLRKELSQA